MERMISAASSLEGLEIVEHATNGTSSPMLRLNLRKLGSKIRAEDLKSDLRTVWRLGVALSANAVYKIIDTVDGFELQFALLFETGEFVTGVIVVDLCIAQAAVAA